MINNGGITDLSNLLDVLVNLSLFFLIVLYIIFSIIVLRQVFLMSDVIITGVNKYVKIFAFLNVVFSFLIAYFIFATLIF
ncbi:hypothetical protein COV24_04870 [candidate division WWE3 bacterium CG10_big_fil_rev_8_21_14_0_10_32_10]|uniref:Uncharacterized protein n=1 Tax=candidate division WWE3 bacterium CG10_big_fil_rev_8_21_14_0_10_32_10 TaxID=1975090 RepID=A0A2H0R935_UNCKA|nr:MAG: hypothetical protein COV24_04870 [candidate division WWE3 bacterium CG10_big_fil_rev_8_21_14_0_10_32_10]